MTTLLDEAPSLGTAMPSRKAIPEGSSGPYRPGFFSEAVLAGRWGRAANTLMSWRTRPPSGRRTLAPDMFGIYAYYSLVSVLLFEAEPDNRVVMSSFVRETTLPLLFACAPAHYRAESYAVMAALAPLDADVRDRVLRAKWAEQPIDALRACSAEMDAWAGVLDQGWTPAAARVEAEPTQPELPLQERVEPEPHLSFLFKTTDLIDARRRPAVKTGPHIEQFDIVAGYAIARDDRGQVWYASVLGGNLNALDWHQVSPLPAPNPVAHAARVAVDAS